MTARRPTHDLVHDPSGAVMLLGLFMGVFLVAILYYVVGIGEAIAQRERMQDAADAAAFSGAVLHARGMNTIALANMVMAALLAILVALKLAEVLAAVAIVLIAIAAFWAPGLASFIPGLEALRRDVRSTHDALKPTIDAALETLHTIEHGIRILVPIAAQARVIGIVRAHYHPPAEVGFMLPSRMALPTEDGTFSEVCDKASGYVGDLVKVALQTSTPPAIAGVLADATADLARADSTWFCGDGSAKPPSTSIRQKLQRPLLPSRKACSEYDADGPGYVAAQHCVLCGMAEYDEVASRHDRTTGACVRDYTDAQRAELARIGCDSDPDGTLVRLDREARDCGRDGAYEQRAALARVQCRPDAKRRLSGFEWMQHDIERTYVFHRAAWRVQRSEVIPGSTQRLKRDVAPCGDVRAVGTQWNTDVQPKGSDEIGALCSGERAPSRPSFEGDELGPVRFTEVLQLFGCVERTTIKRSVAPDAHDEHASPAERTPQHLAASAQLGAEDFQIRAVVLGTPPSSGAHGVIQLASWKQVLTANSAPAEAAFAAASRAAARSAFAQAEYYYAVEDPNADERASYLWNMRWTARFRRFRLPEHAADAAPEAASAQDASRFGLSATAGDAAAACSDARVDADAARDGVPQNAPTCSAFDLGVSNLLIH